MREKYRCLKMRNEKSKKQENIRELYKRNEEIERKNKDWERRTREARKTRRDVGKEKNKISE